MINCEICQSRLLDHAYDLLEGVNLADTTAHLNKCVACQAEMTKVRSEQDLLARAAKAITVVPEFSLTAEKPLCVPRESAVPTTIPFAAPAASNRSNWRRRAVLWSAAAAVLVAVSVAVSAYRVKLREHQDEYAAKKQQHKLIADRFAALPVKWEKVHDNTIQELRAKSAPYLHVVGPTTLQPGAKAHLHITAHHPEGTPRSVKDEFARSDVRVKVVETASGKVLDVERVKTDDDGRAVVELDASGAAANSQLTVNIEAEAGRATTRLAENIQVKAPTYVTRVDTNKMAYQMKDVLFFRVLVLDRYSLQPPAQPLPLRVNLINPAGKVERTLVAETANGGILASEFAIERHFLAGNYTLLVQPVDSAKTRVQPMALPLEVVRELREPDIVLDQGSYLPGGIASGTFQGPAMAPQRALIDNIPVPLTTAPVPMGGAGGAAPGAKGKGVPQTNVTRFTVPIPSTVPGNRRAALTLEMKDGTKRNTALPLGATDFDVDFFPEGGDLVTGVQNRVYYRVRSKTGQPITGDGTVILETSKQTGKAVEIGEIVDSPYQLGMGFFDFTPRHNESYSVRVTTPFKVEVVANPFARLGIKSEGVVLHIPKAVGAQGEPILMTLRQQGPTRKLLLVAECRGQIIDQRWVEPRRGEVDVTLQPTPEASGMIRVTAYERHDESSPSDSVGAGLGFVRPAVQGVGGPVLMPVAERLVYRSATQRLQLSAEPNVSQPSPGQTVTTKIRAQDESGQCAPSWILASVVDERFQARPRSLSAHFFLLNEIQGGADLDSAQLVLHDSPESAQMLERFLGTHGWRRHLRGSDPVSAPQVFSRESQPLDSLQRNYENAITKALHPLHVAGFEEHSLRDTERTEAAVAVLVAATALRDFEESVQIWIRSAMAWIVALLLLGSLLLMGVGMYRILRAHKTATPVFAGAFGCLAVCMTMMFVNSALGPIETSTRTASTVQGPASHEIRQRITDRFAQLPTPRLRAPQPVTGALGLQSGPMSDRQQGIHELAVGNDKDQIRKDANLALRDNIARVMVEREQADARVFTYAKPAMAGGPADQIKAERFEKARVAEDTVKMDAKKGEKAPIAPVVPPQPAPPNAPSDVKATRGASVEYAHKHVPNLLADTLYWNPTLWLETGESEIRFDVGSGQATYRLLLLGHTSTGRFGFHQSRLDVPAVSGR